MRVIQYAIAVILMLISSQAFAFEAKVSRVHDGDSLSITTQDGTVEHIRLYGIDAPETKQPFGYQAKKRLSKLLSRKSVDIEVKDTDRYGRTVALVRLPDGELVNRTMVADGLAWVYDKYCKQQPLCDDLNALQEHARQERLGLWAENDPQRPSDWRRENKTEEWYQAPVRAVKRIVRHVKVVLGK